jgi:hypothetical protein
MRAALDPLRVPSFRAVAFAYSAGQAADWLVEVALALAVFDRTGSPLASALVFVALRVLPVAALPLAAARTLGQLSALRALAIPCLAFGLDALPVWVLLVIGLADGAGSLAGRAGSRAAVVRLVGDPEGVRAGNAVLNFAFALAAACVPLAAGLLGPRPALVLAASLVAVAAVVVRSVDGQGAAFGLMLRGSGVGGLLALETILLVLFTAAVPVEVPLVKETLGAGDGGYGALLAVWGAGMVAGSVAFAWLSRVSLLAVAAAATLAVAGSYALMGLAPSLALACVGAVLGGAGNGMQWVAVVSLAQRRAPTALVARVAGALESVAALAPGAGFLLGGVAVSMLDPRACLLAGAGAIVLTAAGALALRYGWATGTPRGASSPTSQSASGVTRIAPSALE